MKSHSQSPKRSRSFVAMGRSEKEVNNIPAVLYIGLKMIPYKTMIHSNPRLHGSLLMLLIVAIVRIYKIGLMRRMMYNGSV